MQTLYTYRSVIERIVDGDTVDVRLDLGFGIWTQERIRLDNIDTPETRTRDSKEKFFGQLAAQRVEELMPVGSEQVFVSLEFNPTDMYGRCFGDFVVGPDATLTQMLLAEHLAVNYHSDRDARRQAHEQNWQYLIENAVVSSDDIPD